MKETHGTRNTLPHLPHYLVLHNKQERKRFDGFSSGLSLPSFSIHVALGRINQRELQEGTEKGVSSPYVLFPLYIS